MMAQMEYQAQEITEKIGQLKALKEEMERKEQLFEECSRQLQVYNSGKHSRRRLKRSPKNFSNKSRVVWYRLLFSWTASWYI
jgi:hypothetical protein